MMPQELKEIRYCSEAYVRGAKEELRRRREEAYRKNEAAR